MSEVLFVSALPFGRCKSITRIFDMYDGPKAFRCGADGMRSAEADGFSVVVCDSLPAYIEGKDKIVSVNLGHGLTGGKLYGLDEGEHPWVDRDALAQIDYAIATSEAGVPIVARQLGVPAEKVLPLGMARTDAYFEDGRTVNRLLHNYERVYLYCPTFRGLGDKGHLPRIDWDKIDSLLDNDEIIVVKRHHLTPHELTCGYDLQRRRVMELPFEEPTEFWLRSCDVMMTDYSSTMFDALVLGVPLLLLVDDKDEYLSGRGMYHPYPDFYSSRWIEAEGNEEDFVSMLREAAENGMGDTERECLSAVAGACDGHSTERICELVRSLL
jgi:CDP-ribitol ribitolphosphotransferase